MAEWLGKFLRKILEKEKLIYLVLISSYLKKIIWSGSESVMFLAVDITEENLALLFGVILGPSLLENQIDMVV